jgi:hypothetical protein
MPMSMSAADYTRMLRRKGGMNLDYTVGGATDATGNFPKDKDVSPTMFPQKPYDGGDLRVRSVVGTSKTRRPASDWTNYLGARNADYVLKSQGGGSANETSQNTGAVKFKLVQVAACRCTTLPSITLPKYAGCMKCNPAQHRVLN